MRPNGVATSAPGAEVVAPVHEDEVDAAPHERGDEDPEAEVREPLRVLPPAARLALGEPDADEERRRDEEAVGVERQPDLAVEDARAPERRRGARRGRRSWSRRPAAPRRPRRDPPRAAPAAHVARGAPESDRDEHRERRRELPEPGGDDDVEEDGEHGAVAGRSGRRPPPSSARGPATARLLRPGWSDQHRDPDDDERVGDVEGRPAHVRPVPPVPLDEVDDVPAREPVEEVAHRAGEHERERHLEEALVVPELPVVVEDERRPRRARRA